MLTEERETYLFSFYRSMQRAASKASGVSYEPVQAIYWTLRYLAGCLETTCYAHDVVRLNI